MVVVAVKGEEVAGTGLSGRFPDLRCVASDTGVWPPSFTVYTKYLLNLKDKDEFTRGQKAEGLAMRRLSSMVGSPGGQVVSGRENHKVGERTLATPSHAQDARKHSNA